MKIDNNLDYANENMNLVRSSWLVFKSTIILWNYKYLKNLWNFELTFQYIATCLLQMIKHWCWFDSKVHLLVIDKSIKGGGGSGWSLDMVKLSIKFSTLNYVCGAEVDLGSDQVLNKATVATRNKWLSYWSIS